MHGAGLLEHFKYPGYIHAAADDAGEMVVVRVGSTELIVRPRRHGSVFQILQLSPAAVVTDDGV